MERFLALPAEKQSIIIDAALASYGRNGYKKASTADVAAASGISKGMVFHYFGTKKDMYLYLCEFCFKEMRKTLGGVKDVVQDDFFDRVRYSARAKIEILRKYPHMLAFLKSVYAESDPEVVDELRRFRQLVAPSQREFVVEEGDSAKFKDGVDPERVLQMLTWMGVGSIDQVSGSLADEDGFQELLTTFDECLTIMKNNFYKEEYL